MLPVRSILIGQKLVENAKIQKRHFEEFSSNVRHLEPSIFSKTIEKLETFPKNVSLPNREIVQLFSIRNQEFSPFQVSPLVFSSKGIF